jgi:hypothetical protein
MIVRIILTSVALGAAPVIESVASDLNQVPPPVSVALQPTPAPEVVEPPREDIGPIADTTEPLFKPIDEISMKVAPIPADLERFDYAESRFARFGEEFQPLGTGRGWSESTFAWTASALRHQPLYFEEVNLERYGHSVCCVQPVISGGQFFGRAIALPYFIGAECPCKIEYTLGHYRPGSHAPFRLHKPPCSVRGALLYGALATGAVFALP